MEFKLPLAHDGEDFASFRSRKYLVALFVFHVLNCSRVSKALNRSVTGSLNQMIYEATISMVEFGVSPFEVGFRLNDSLFSILATEKSRNYGPPNEAFKLLADGYLPGED